MTRIEHDGAASLTVVHRRPSNRRRGWCSGWRVVRTCACHFGEAVTVPFDSRERAERALQFLDADARMRAASAPLAS